MSYLQQLFSEIANDAKKPVSAMDPFIKILEENWIDSKEALQEMNEDSLMKLKIPMFVCKQIIKKVNGQQQVQQVQQVQQNVNQVQNQQQELLDYTKMQQNAQQIIQQEQQHQQEQVYVEQVKLQCDNIFKSLFQQYISEAQLRIAILQTLQKIISMIKDNPNEIKYRQLNKTGKTFSNKILPYEQANELLQLVGFDYKKNEQQVVMENVNLQIIRIVCNQLEDEIYKAELTLNAYKQHNSYVEGLTQEQKQNIQIDDWQSKINQLIQKRQELMSKPIQNRELKIYRVKPREQREFGIEYVEDQQEIEKEYEDKEILQSKEFVALVKQICQSFGDQKFASKRKKEFEQLSKQSCFEQTRIKVKFPNYIILECLFSPMEKVKLLTDIVKVYIAPEYKDKFYIYTNFPRRNLSSSKEYSQTFFDLESVPGDNYILGIQGYDIVPENVLDPKYLAQLQKQ